MTTARAYQYESHAADAIEVERHEGHPELWSQGVLRMRSLLILVSYHNHNTEKVAKVIASVLDAEIRAPQQTIPEDVRGYDLVGFGSGVYGSKLHESLLQLTDRLPKVAGKKAFIFSTFGAPVAAFEGEKARARLEDYVEKNHSSIKEKLQSKGYSIVGEFGCGGLNTNSFLRIFGGINKGRPNSEDLKRAETFALGLREAREKQELDENALANGDS